MTSKQVTLNGMPLHGSDRVGQWVVEKLTGWHDSPELRGDGDARPWADGNYETERFYGPRLITIDGILFHKGRSYALQAVDHINQFASRNTGELSITDGGVTKTSVVKALGVDHTTVSPTAIRFQVRLNASDPVLYGLRHSFAASVGSAVAVFHRGNYSAVPRVVVSGSMPGGYTLTLAGSSVVVTEPLVSGSPHTVDYRKRRLYKGGAPVRGGLSTASYARVEPGQRDTFSITPNTTGTATATMTLYDTYI